VAAREEDAQVTTCRDDHVPARLAVEAPSVIESVAFNENGTNPTDGSEVG
jgi:hypothetical protein